MVSAESIGQHKKSGSSRNLPTMGTSDSHASPYRPAVRLCSWVEDCGIHAPPDANSQTNAEWFDGNELPPSKKVLR